VAGEALMADTLRVAVLVGSLRRGSFSRKVARAAIALAPNSLAMEIVEIGKIVTAFEQWIRTHR
jgi:chromate reductase